MKKLYLLLLAVFLLSSGNSSLFAHYPANTKKTALLIIDIQEFYFPGGTIPLNNPEKAATNASRLIRAFRDRELPIIHIRHEAGSGGDIHPMVQPLEKEKVISKNKANAFVGTGLLDYLKDHQITELIICGMQTHMCVEAATRAASDYGFDCTVIEDACTTRDLQYEEAIVTAKDVHLSTLSSLNKTYATIKTTQEFLDELK
ncbi:MAG: cysteine hydrolase family protein [Bacteroidales bacterium]|jgi:nicotinamidase-related amidase|nr:cysteine hydrolase family protein [Bacteroidales bacterium]